MKKIADFMTPCPYTISAKALTAEAVEKMELQNIRHMPVVDEGELVGVVTRKDAKLVGLIGETTTWNPTVGDICQKEPVIVACDMCVSEVAYRMAEEKLDYVLIADQDEHIVGIFTTTDACRYIYFLTS